MWHRHAPAAALAAAFVATVILGRSLSARNASASDLFRPQVETLPSLASEIGVTPIVTLIGRDAIVRIGICGNTRVYSVFDRAGALLATRLTQSEFARMFPTIRLEQMHDVADGCGPSMDALVDTPDPSVGQIDR